jgi:hypothetical protein
MHSNLNVTRTKVFTWFARHKRQPRFNEPFKAFISISESVILPHPSLQLRKSLFNGIKVG